MAQPVSCADCSCRFGDVLASFLVLQRVTPVTHSVGNCVKRVVCLSLSARNEVHFIGNILPSAYPVRFADADVRHRRVQTSYACCHTPVSHACSTNAPASLSCFQQHMTRMQVVIAASIFVFKTAASMTNIAGTALALSGVLLYSLAKRSVPGAVDADKVGSQCTG
jgi:Triose-phosphate Transporter family